MNQLSRRSILRAAGATLALPFMQSALPRAAWGANSPRPPVRLGIFSVTGGTVLESWKPKEVGALDKLPSILRPLEANKSDITVVSGLCQGGRSDNLNGHEHCAFTHLTGAGMTKKEGGKIFASVSVDQCAAQALGKETLLPSLEIGLNGNQTYSFKSADMTVPSEANPRLVYERMFRGRQPVVPNWKRRAEQANIVVKPAEATSREESLDRSVLDLVLSQARDVRRGLGKHDQQKLDRYLDSVRSVEKRLEFIERRHQDDVLDAALPGPSKLVSIGELPKEGIPIWEITRPIDQDPSRHADYIRLMSDLMVLAFQTDMTRVVTFSAGSDESMFPGVVTVGYERHCHTLEHQGNAGRPEDADPIAREACRQIHAWYTGLFADCIRKMQSIDEGAGTLLDNSVIMYTSYMSNGGHGRDDYPVLLAGQGGGAIKSGRHLDYGRAPVSNLYVEMLNMLGLNVESFGDSHTSEFAGKLNGRLPGLV